MFILFLFFGDFRRKHLDNLLIASGRRGRVERSCPFCAVIEAPTFCDLSSDSSRIVMRTLKWSSVEFATQAQQKNAQRKKNLRHWGCKSMER